MIGETEGDVRGLVAVSLLAYFFAKNDFFKVYLKIGHDMVNSSQYSGS